MITRLRPLPDLAATYPVPHDGAGHGDRIARTIEFGQQHVPREASVADLSCGTAEIPRALCRYGKLTLGDYAPGYEITGPIEDTCYFVHNVDLWVLCETLEHLDNPDLVLNLLRERASMLLLSTPVGCWGDTNAEHCWAWDRIGVEGLLLNADWTPEHFLLIEGAPYNYGTWIAT